MSLMADPDVQGAAIGRSIFPRHPVVSIVTPSFNQARFLLATLESVYAQDYPALEHIVIDGGSRDGSVEILKRFAKHHPLRWLSEPDDGQADAIVKGLRMASGEVLTWLNSDDVYLRPDSVSRVVDLIRGGAPVVTGAGAYIDTLGRHLSRIRLRRGELDRASIERLDTVLQPATFFVRQLLDEVTIDRSLHYAFDWDLFIQMSRRAEFTPLDVEIAGYRLHADGKTVSGGIRRQEELLSIARRYGRAAPVIWAMETQIRVRKSFPVLTPVLDRLAWWSHKLTGGHGIPH